MVPLSESPPMVPVAVIGRFGGDVTKGSMRIHFVAGIGGNADGDVRKRSLQIDVLATRTGICGDIDGAILIVHANLSADTFKVTPEKEVSTLASPSMVLAVTAPLESCAVNLPFTFST